MTTARITAYAQRIMVTKKQIKELCDQIVHEFQPEKIILFGSHAYGKPTPDSDVDLLVVMPYEGGYRKQLVKMLNKIETYLPMDLLLRTPEEISERLELGDFFIKEIIERGKVMYDATDSGVGGQSRRRLERRTNALSRT